jgi:hypothetical protein
MIHLPTLTENGKWIYCSSDRAGINESMTYMFANIPKALSSSTDFFHREVNPPHHDPIVYAQYMISYYKVLLMQSLELTGKSKNYFCYFYLVPDSKLHAKECESTLYNHKAEELLGKAKENLNKVKTTITMSTAIGNMHNLCAYLVNICTIIEAQFVCYLAIKNIHIPAMFVVAHTFTIHLSSASMHTYHKKRNCSHKPLILWVVQMLD